jgi:hypothetical protein
MDLFIVAFEDFNIFSRVCRYQLCQFRPIKDLAGIRAVAFSGALTDWHSLQPIIDFRRVRTDRSMDPK